MAENLLIKHHITDPIIGVAEIAENEGFEFILYNTKEDPALKNISGFSAISADNIKVIAINKDESPTRKFYIVAHELGHFILGHKNAPLLNADHVFAGDNASMELEADLFAAHLLVPLDMLRKELSNENIKSNIAKELIRLSACFGVDAELIKYQWLKVK
jgi:Zn-dependent peptidase ImmA (M78 family)